MSVCMCMHVCICQKSGKRDFGLYFSSFCCLRSCLLIHMNNTWICAVSCVQMVAGCSAWQKLEHWTLCTNWSTKCFKTAVLMGTIDFYCCIALSLILAWVGVHEVSTKWNLLGFIFFYTFWLIRTKMWYDVEAFYVEHTDTIFEWDLCNQTK